MPSRGSRPRAGSGSGLALTILAAEVRRGRGVGCGSRCCGVTGSSACAGRWRPRWITSCRSSRAGRTPWTTCALPAVPHEAARLRPCDLVVGNERLPVDEEAIVVQKATSMLSPVNARIASCDSRGSSSRTRCGLLGRVGGRSNPNSRESTEQARPPVSSTVLEIRVGVLALGPAAPRAGDHMSFNASPRRCISPRQRGVSASGIVNRSRVSDVSALLGPLTDDPPPPGAGGERRRRRPEREADRRAHTDRPVGVPRAPARELALTRRSANPVPAVSA